MSENFDRILKLVQPFFKQFKYCYSGRTALRRWNKKLFLSPGHGRWNPVKSKQRSETAHQRITVRLRFFATKRRKKKPTWFSRPCFLDACPSARAGHASVTEWRVPFLSAIVLYFFPKGLHIIQPHSTRQKVTVLFQNGNFVIGLHTQPVLACLWKLLVLLFSTGEWVEHKIGTRHTITVQRGDVLQLSLRKREVTVTLAGRWGQCEGQRYKGCRSYD